MPLGSLNLSTSKRPASRSDMHMAMIMPCFLLTTFCGLFGIGLVTNYVKEMTHEGTHFKSVCYILNFTAVRTPCKGVCWQPAWTVNLTMTDDFAVVNVTEQPGHLVFTKFWEAVENAMSRESLNTMVACYYDPLTYKETTRFTAPDPVSARGKVIAMYFFACLGAFSILLMISNCIIRPKCFEPAVKAYTNYAGDQSCWRRRTTTAPAPIPVESPAEKHHESL